MSRWLEMARKAVPLSELTELTESTPDTKPEAPSTMGRVNSVDWVNSEGREPRTPSAQARILAAIQAGCRTPGAIATATRLGATATYQELDRMAEAGLIERPRSGVYSASPAIPHL